MSAITYLQQLSSLSLGGRMRGMSSAYLRLSPGRMVNHPIIFMQCGPVRHRVDARTPAAERGIYHRVRDRSTKFELPSSLVSVERPSMPAIYAALAQDSERNDLIFDDVLKSLESKSSPIVL